MKKRVINILFNDFTNDNRVLKESISLIKGEYKVELVATKFDNNLPNKEIIFNIKVKREGVGKEGFLPLNLIIFWIKIIRKYRKEKLFHCNDLYAFPPAYFIKNFVSKDVKIVYDCHEHETEAGIYIGKPVLKFFAKLFEKIMIKSADEVITVSESIANDYVSMYGIKKPRLILNCPIYKEYPKYDLFREKFGIEKDKILFLYQGEYLKGRGIERLVDIFKQLEKKNSNLVLILLVYGENLNTVKEMIKDSKNIYWHGRVSKDIYMKYVNSADWGIYLMENTCKNHDFALPNKIFDYIMAGLPLVVSDLKEMGRFVQKENLGYVIDSDDKDTVVDLLSKINKESKEKFLSRLQETSKKYNWEQQEKVLLKIYNTL